MKIPFLPRPENFYQFFQTQAKFIQKASTLLVEQSASSNGNSEALFRQIAILESESDAIVHQVTGKLSHTFITPLDPEDIHLLATTLDDVMDGIEDVSYRLSAFKPRTRMTEVHQICELIAECTAPIEQGITAIEKGQDVSDVCKTIGALEDRADTVIRCAMSELIECERDAIEIMKVKEIYEYLERIADRCEDVSDLFESVTVKNG